MPSRQDTRRRQIIALLHKRAVRSQAELRELLAGRGVDVNQGTLSRDLRDLGVLKGKDGYALPEVPGASPENAHRSLWHAVKTWLVDATPAENLVVLHTPAGGANPLGLALDHAGLPEVIGTIAGDDTVLAICRDPKTARGLAKKLTADLAGRRRA